MNPINIIKQFMTKGKKPQDFINQVFSNNNNNNPMIKNLIDMARNGNYEGVKSFAQNLYKDKGLDFDKEFDNFMGQIKG